MAEHSPRSVNWRDLHPAEPLSIECLKTADIGLLQSLIRQRAQPLSLGSDRVLNKTLGRYKAFYDPDDLGFAGHVMLDGYWEIWLTRFILTQVQPGMNFLDVGANFGYYSLLMSDLVGQDGRGWAVEPNPHTATYLKSSIALNGFDRRTKVVQAALSDRPAERARFYVPPHEPKNARLVPPGFSGDTEGKFIDVPITTVDAMISPERVDFVKIDAEGAEHGIFKGMAEVISRWRPKMIVEFNARRGDARAFIDDMARSYGSLRYLETDGRLYDIDEARLMSEKLGQDWLIFLADR